MPSLKLSNPFRRGADRPSLRERAAALKATAGRVMRRPVALPAPVEEAVDWHSPPPGFMAHPAIEPGGFVKVAHGIRIEVGRLYVIALAEFERRRGAYDGRDAGPDAGECVAQLRRSLRVDALAAALAEPEIAELMGVSQRHTAADPDADLIALGLELDAAREREAEADADCDARADAATAAMPARPACLTFRESDHPFGLIRNSIHSSGMDGLAVEHDDIAWMRRGPRKHQVLRDPLPGEHGWRDYGGKVPEMQPWPEAQARADEILAAWDAWQTARQAVDRAHGVYEAEARYEKSGKEVTAILERIVTLPAHTAEDLRIKLRAIRHGVVDASDDTAACRVFRSLLRDAGVPEVEIAAEA